MCTISGVCVGTQSKKILLVDDFIPWRQFLRTLLSVTPEWQVCGEAENGIEALAKAEDLHADLVLLDLDLPDLTGIEVANRLRLLAQPPAIVILTADASPDFVKAAMATGALGYLLKSEVVAELLPALKEVFSGKRFISPAIQM